MNAEALGELALALDRQRLPGDHLREYGSSLVLDVGKRSLDVVGLGAVPRVRV